MNYNENKNTFVNNSEDVTSEEVLKKGRGKNVKYMLIKDFDSKQEFDQYWNEHNYSEAYYKHGECHNYVGEEQSFRCKFSKKVGFVSCKKKTKIIFPDRDQSVLLYESEDIHDHTRNCKVVTISILSYIH